MAAPSIGDLILQLVADATGLKASVIKEAKAAGDAGAQTMGQSMSGAFKTGAVKAFGLVASGAFALATKGALELENVQVDLQRELGITGDEARAAAKDINSIAGRNVAQIADVSKAYQKVRTDLGLVGEEATKATEAFVKFGRATNIDAAKAVEGFDDVLDAWNLEATDSQRIMDQLVVSHQKYGGSIEGNLDALAKLAPQLQALNADEEDGIALLNLFAASGVDSSKALTALNTAVKNLKPGQDLNDLIAQVSAIEDPTLRAQKAIELFGAKGGVALANVLKPGISSLDAFAISAEESAGATEKAADAIDSSISGKIRKALSIGGAALRGFGADFGPALTGMASLGTLATTVAPGLGSKLAKGLLGGLKGIGAKIMSAIGIQVAGAAAASAGGEVIGEAIGKSVSKGIGVRALASSLGDKIASALDAVPGSGALKSSMKRLSGFLQTKLGAGLVLGVTIVVAKVATDKVGEVVSEQIAEQVEKGNLEGLKAGLEAAEFALRAAQAGPTGMLWDITGMNDGLKANVEQLKAGIAQLEAESDRGMAEFAGKVEDDAYQAGAAIPQGIVKGIDQYAPTIRDHFNTSIGDAVAGDDDSFSDRLFRQGADAIKSYADGLRSKRSEPVDALDELKEMLKHPFSRFQETLRLAGQLSSKALKEGLQSNDPDIKAQAEYTKKLILDRFKEMAAQGAPIGDKAMAELREAMHSSNPEIARAAQEIYDTIKGRLDKIPPAGTVAGTDTGANVATGLDSKSPAVTTAATGLKNDAKGQLDKLPPAGWSAGTQTGQKLDTGLTSKGKDVDDAALALKRKVTGKLDDIPPLARIYGEGTGKNYASGLKAPDVFEILRNALGAIAGAVADFFKAGSPTKLGPLSEDGGTEGWGERLGSLLAEGFGSTERLMQRAALGAASALASGIPGSMAGPSLALAGPYSAAGRSASYAPSAMPMGGGGDTYQITVPVQGLVEARSPEDIARPLRQLASTGYLERPRHLTTRPTRG